MKQQVGDPSTLKGSLRDVRDSFLKDDVTIVGFFTGEDDPVYKTYQAACEYGFLRACEWRLTFPVMPVRTDFLL